MRGKTSVYAVARQGQDEQHSELHQYHKSQHKWTIMIESHPLLGRSEVKEYCATWDDEAGHSRIHPLELGSHDTIIGSVLISDSSHASQKDVERVIKDQQETKSSSLDAGSTSEDWLKHALHTLQEQKLLESFDSAAFMTFANSYVANRQAEDSDAPATIAYPRLHSESETKAKKRGFWVSYPETAGNKYGEKIYGGLM